MAERGAATLPGRGAHGEDARLAAAPIDLLLRPAELGPRLVDAVRRSAWLDAYLFAAGLNQIAEDHLHASLGRAGEVADQLLAADRLGRATAAHSLGRAESLTLDFRSMGRSRRRALVWQRAAAEVVAALARQVCAPGTTPGAPGNALEAKVAALVHAIGRLPVELRSSTVRRPSCFQAFDLDVPDVVELVARFERTCPDRARPLLVAGVRTSGSYLGPLCAAALESSGYRDVRLLTLRPQHQLLPEERRVVREAAARDGCALVIDDPPQSGRAVARVAERLERLGLPPQAIVLLLPLFGEVDSLPATLEKYPSVLLPAGDWAIEGKLEPNAVGRMVARLSPGDPSVERAVGLPLPAQVSERGHRRALVQLDLLERGAAKTVRVLVEGAGIGYFGEQAIAVADALREHVTEILGVEGGCLYRHWLPEEQRAHRPGGPVDDELLEAVTTYVADRRRALAVAEDRSIDQVGEQPVWEVASRILGRVFGRAAVPARQLVVDAIVRRLLRVAQPSVTDGAASLENWFEDRPGSGRLVKVDFAKRSFWNLGLLSYDAGFDLAGAALSVPDDAVGDRLRSRWADLCGEEIDDERWLLFQLAHLVGRGRATSDERAALELEGARCVQRYLARCYMDDLSGSGDGALCALDIDGVLDTDVLGFPATTAAGAMALRAMIAHGYRPVLVSGRSLEEVADRCRAYGLAGGVAEYGSVVWTARDGSSILVSDEERRLLAGVRDYLAERDGVHLANAYRHSVRAYLVDRRGDRRPLDSETAEAARRAVGDPAGVRLVVGESQTDFVGGAVDKGRGVRALARLLGAPQSEDHRPLALAVGDTASDLPMLREARLAFAPAQARGVMRGTGVEVLPAAYQTGLSLAVERLLGHPPGGCPACRPPQLSAEARLLVATLSAGEAGRVGLVPRFVRLRRLVGEASF